MSKKISLIVVLILFFIVIENLSGLAFAELKDEFQEVMLQDKVCNIQSDHIRILIISNDGGGGHKAAAEAVNRALSDEIYETHIITPTQGKLASKYFDYWFSKQNWTMLKSFTMCQPVAEKYLELIGVKKIKKQIKDYRPNFIVSVQPVGNYIYQKIADKEGIPFILVPTDLDSRGFVNHIIDHKDPTKFLMGIALDDEKIKETLRVRNIETIDTIGYPLRLEFENFAREYRLGRKEKEIRDFKKEMNMGANDKLLFISIGAKGFGLATIREYIDLIIENYIFILDKDKKDQRIHVMVATGRNDILNKVLNKKAKYLSQKQLPIVLHAEGWLNGWEMAIRMASSDVNLIKPGGSTLNEVLAVGKHALLKSDSAKALEWEKFNMDFAVEKGWATRLSYTSKNGHVNGKSFIRQLAKAFLRSQIKVDPSEMPPINNFSKNFLNLIEEISFEKHLK